MPPPRAGAISRRSCALARVMQPLTPGPPIATTDVAGHGRIGGSVAAASLERRVGTAGRDDAGGGVELPAERATVIWLTPNERRSIPWSWPEAPACPGSCGQRVVRAASCFTCNVIPRVCGAARRARRAHPLNACGYARETPARRYPLPAASQ